MMEKELTQEQSLEMIRSMISISRQNFRNGGIYYILYGSLFFLTAIVQYILYTVYSSELHWLSWLAAGAVAIVISVVMGARRKKSPGVKTYISRMNFYLWTAFIVSIIFIGFLASQGILTETEINPLIIMLYGFATFISGGMLKFKWLIIGAIIAWIIAIISSFMDYSIQMLLIALTILLSYLIPGILLSYSPENHA